MNNQDNDPLMPRIDQEEATDSNPVPLSPTDPAHRTSDGDTAPDGDTPKGVIPRIVAPLTRAARVGAGGDVRPGSDDAEIRSDSEGQV